MNCSENPTKHLLSKAAAAIDEHATARNSRGNRLATERHFTPEELGELWKLHPDTIRRRFAHEPGVLVLEDRKPGKRRYRTMRIPESVAMRVHGSREVA